MYHLENSDDDDDGDINQCGFWFWFCEYGMSYVDSYHIVKQTRL